MEHIKEALIKAHASLEGPESQPFVRQGPEVDQLREPEFAPPLAALNKRILERNRVVSYEMSDPAHIPFNMLRTKVRGILLENKWTKLGITSPTPACGKTVISVNLGLSLARAGNIRTVLVDLDLRRPGIARTVGLQPHGTIGKFLRGECEVEDCFVQVEPGLIIGLGGGHLRQSSELMQGQQMADLMLFVTVTLAADVVIFDLPPMGGSDDAIAFLPFTDSMLLVAAAGQTTASQLNECERQLSEQDKLFGLVLNKSQSKPKEYYY